MRVANGHKGKAGYECSVTGLASHSALNHLGVNAIEIAALIIVHLRRRNLDFRAHGPFADGFEPPHCTVTTGLVAGGTALNIVPGACRFAFEFRTLPGQDAAALLAEVQAFAEAELLPAMRARHPGAAIAWRELMSYPALGGAGQAGFERLCCELAGGGAPRKVAFGTEAGLFAARGIASVVCGPGDIAVAHQPDEYVERAELERCARFLRRWSVGRWRPERWRSPWSRSPRRTSAAWRDGNTGIPYVTTLDSGRAGPHAVITRAGPRQRAVRRLGAGQRCSSARCGPAAAGCRSPSSTPRPTSASIRPTRSSPATSTRTSTGSGTGPRWTARGARPSSSGRARSGR